MIPPVVRLFNPQGEDRVAVVAAEPSAQQPGAYLIRVGRGATASRLTKGTTYGPYDEEELEGLFAEAVESLRAEGFMTAGLHALLTALQNSGAKARALAAVRLGWRRDPEAVGPLLAALPNAVDDVCPILDALGAIGDKQSVPVLRDYAERKLLSRRRSAVEALRNATDKEGVDRANQRALERLSPAIRAALEATGDGADQVTMTRLCQSVLVEPIQQRGLALDTLYELASPAAVAAVRLLLTQIRFDQAHVWRYVKSVFKRSMLRHDYATFGLLAHAVEAQGRKSTGTTANVKSGYDGAQRLTNIFRQKTQHYARRLAWRYLRRLAKYRPGAYPHAAAEAIIHYSPADAEEEQDLYGPFASCYLLHRVIFGDSERFTLDNWRLKFRYASARAQGRKPTKREEAFPELWDAEPRAYLRVLGAAKLPEVHPFALRTLSTERMKEAVLYTANHDEVLALLDAPYEPTVEFGLEELDRRFDADRPDWSLLARVLADERKLVREMAKRWVRLTAPAWTADPERVVAFLDAAHPEVRPLIVEMAHDGLRDHPDARQKLALRLLVLLRSPEIRPGTHEGYAQLARIALLDELGAVLTVDELIALVSSGSAPAQSVAGELLGRRTDAAAELGLERLTLLAQHDVAAVRAAAHRLLRASVAHLKADPSPLFVLVESEWPDTRAAAGELLRAEIDLESLGLDGLTGLLDSNRTDVQEVGRDLVKKHYADHPPADLIYRLAEHPHPALRRFTLELILRHLPEGVEPLRRVLGFCRAALFDLWPSRKVKLGTIEMLAARGLRDEEQARAVAGLLGELVRVQGRAEFERAMEGLVRIKLAYPEVETVIALRAGG